MATSSLKSKTISGMLWGGLQKFGVTIISFLTNIVLARLLTADDFGSIGMIMVFIAFANTFIDGGFGSALIQKRRPTDDDYSTIFNWNLLLSIILFIALLFGAPAVAKFYKMPSLTNILRILGIILISNSLSIVQHNLLRKNLEFKKIAIINLVATLSGAILGIVFAFYGFGVWSLVIKMIIISIITTLLLWIFSKWKPKLIFNVQSFKELFSFGGFILLSNLFTTLYNNVQSLIIGRFFSSDDLGYYTQARQLRNVPAQSISAIVGQVSFPVFSEIQDDNKKLNNALVKTVSSIAYINFPLMILLIIIAKPLIIFLFSEKWIESIPYFQLLCMSGLFIALQDVNYHVIAAMGKSKLLLKWNIIKNTIGILLMLIGIKVYGIYGLLIGMIVGSTIIYIINGLLAAKVCNCNFYDQIKKIIPIFLISFVVGFFVWFVSRYINIHQTFLMCLQVLIYLGLYVLITYIFRIESLKEYLSIIRTTWFSYIKKNKHHK